MKILFFDTETEGLKKEHKPVEIGYALVESDYNFTILQQGSFLLPGVPADITGIPAECTTLISGDLRHLSMQCFKQAINECDVMVAHHISFDLRQLAKIMSSVSKPTFCFCNDIDWHYLGCSSKKLTNIANKLGVQVLNAHTALSDVIIMIECAKNIDKSFFVDLIHVEKKNTKKQDSKPKEEKLKPKKEDKRVDVKFIYNCVSEEEIKKYELTTESESYVLIKKDISKSELMDLMNTDSFFRPPKAQFKVGKFEC